MRLLHRECVRGEGADRQLFHGELSLHRFQWILIVHLIGMATLHVTGLPCTTGDELLRFLGAAGAADVRMGCGEADISFSDAGAADHCMKYMNHAYFKSSEVRISRLLPAEQRTEMRKWKLRVRNLPINVNLYQHFAKFGEIHRMNIHYDGNGEPYVALQYVDEEAAKMACSEESSMSVAFVKRPLIEFPEGAQIMEVTGLPADMSESELRELVSKFGDVRNVYMNQRADGDDKVYSFVNFASRRQRKNAIRELDGKRINKCTIHASRLLDSSPFYQGERSGQRDGGNKNYFKPNKGKYYVEFVEPPVDLDEHKIRSLCCRYGVIYDVSIDSKAEGVDYRCSHVGFSTKGQMRKALDGLSANYNVKRLSKNSPFFKC